MVYRRRKKTSVQAAVRKELNKQVETKVDVTTFNNSLDSATPFAYNPFDQLQEGTDINQRVGQSVYVKSVGLRSIVLGADTPYNRIRVTMVETRKPLTPSIGNSYDGEAIYNPLYASIGLNAPIDYTVVKKVHFDKVLNLQLNQWNIGLSGRNVQKTFNRRITLNRKIYFDDTNSGLQNNCHANFYLVMSSDSGIAPHPSMDWATTVRFQDM